jgi:hypothetical protein
MSWMDPNPEMRWKSSFWKGSSARRAQAAKSVRDLRDIGFSYEEIPDHMPDPDGGTPAPWAVYELANPSKTAEQVAAWKARHHPQG